MSFSHEMSFHGSILCSMVVLAGLLVLLYHVNIQHCMIALCLSLCLCLCLSLLMSQNHLYSPISFARSAIQQYQKMHSKSALRKFLELCAKRNVAKVAELVAKGTDPNFHDDETGETCVSWHALFVLSQPPQCTCARSNTVASPLPCSG